MPKITFQPMNMTVEGKVGQSILEIAIEHDVPIQHACGGFCACTTCHIHVEQGSDSLSEMEEDEDERIAAVDQFTLKSRLSCQTKLGSQDIVVTVINEV